MKWRSLNSSLLIFAAIMGLSCGGGVNSGPEPSSMVDGSGRLRLQIRWPDSPVPGQLLLKRLIPMSANSIVVTLLRSGTEIARTNPPIHRPQTTYSFDNVPVGPLTIVASAFASTDGTGPSLASGSVEAIVILNRTTEAPTLTMSSPVVSVTVTPNPSSVSVGSTVQLTATARDSEGGVVMVPDGLLIWVSSNTSLATVSSTGLVTGITAGNTIITVTETGSGISGSSDVEVIAVESYVLERQWGSDGFGNGQFATAPHGIAVGPDGNIYVTEDTFVGSPGGGRVQVFDSIGNFLRSFGGSSIITRPLRIALDTTGNIYIAEIDSFNLNPRISKFDNAGNLLRRWGSRGMEDGQFMGLSDLTVDTLGSVYTVEAGTARVQKFTNDGMFITKWGGFGPPRGITVDTIGNVLVSVVGEAPRILRFRNDGTFLNSWGEFGSEDGQLFGPIGLATDIQGNVFVVDSEPRVQKFTSSGQFVTRMGPVGEQFLSGWAIALDASGNVYVTVPNMDKVLKFRPVIQNLSRTLRKQTRK